MRACLLLPLLCLLGCQEARLQNSQEKKVEAPVASMATAETNSPPLPIRTQVETTLRSIFARRLNTRDHGAWQVVHGCIPFREDFQIEHEGREISALDFLLSGGELTGWELKPGIKLASHAGRRGLRAPVRPGSATAQGHADQWLGYLASCNLPLETPIEVQGESFTLADALAQMEYDVPHNVEQEYSWTLMALAKYRPHDYSWTAADGADWNVEKIVEIECSHDLRDSPCAGAHRMVGLSLAFRRWQSEQGERSTTWERLESRLKRTVNDVRSFQNADGSLSSDSFARPFQSADIGQQIAAGGHVLEFLTIQLTPEELRESWVERAVMSQCRLLQATEKNNVHCGALYHAASALRLYYERVFGEISFR
jgi:hypothetical protein